MDQNNIESKLDDLINRESFFVDYDVRKSIKSEGLSSYDYIEIVRRLNRPPNRTELGMFGVMWSEHCCYRNSRPLLSGFPTKGKNILVGPGENAGVVDLGDGFRLAFKIESHNHPSAIEPFQGAATGVGGILRDIFTMGARPIALLNSLRFGPLNENQNIGILEGVVSGISHYGNCVGVPTVGGEVAFDDGYSGNPLVNAMALGVMETEKIVCSGATGIGFPVVYVGSTTGRDGMGGASFASAELSQQSLDDRPAVQVGDPFLEKGLIEGCLEAFQTGDVVAAQDMGAAGLTCSCSEMAAKGEVGIELDLNKVPAREEGMTPYDFLLSESQERMLFVVKPGSEQFIMDIFLKWGLQAAVVGKVLKENIIRVLFNNQVVVDLPANALAEDTPIENHKLLSEVPNEVKIHWKWDESQLPKPQSTGIDVVIKDNQTKFLNWNQITLKLLDEPNIASKEYIYQQYDYQVQNNTIVGPGKADAAVIRLRSNNKNINKGVVAVVDCPNRWVSLDPERGSIAAVAEAARNISCVGGKPLAVTDNLNFSSPEKPFGYWQLAMSCKGLSNACRLFDTPVTGGNVSLYNETLLPNGSIQPIPPTPVIGMIGVIDDINNALTQSWKKPGDYIFMLGVPLETINMNDDRITLNASAYLEHIFTLKTGRPPIIDIDLERNIQSFVRNAISNRLLKSAHDVGDGGLVVSIAECCISSGFGASISLPNSMSRLDRLLFAEGGSRVIVSVSSSNIREWYNYLKKSNNHNTFCRHIGLVNDINKIVFTQSNNELINLSVSDIKMAYNNAITRRLSYE